jgi:hypothetical protein
MMMMKNDNLMKKCVILREIYRERDRNRQADRPADRKRVGEVTISIVMIIVIVENTQGLSVIIVHHRRSHVSYPSAAVSWQQNMNAAFENSRQCDGHQVRQGL